MGAPQYAPMPYPGYYGAPVSDCSVFPQDPRVKRACLLHRRLDLDNHSALTRRTSFSPQQMPPGYAPPGYGMAYPPQGMPGHYGAPQAVPMGWTGAPGQAPAGYPQPQAHPVPPQPQPNPTPMPAPGMGAVGVGGGLPGQQAPQPQMGTPTRPVSSQGASSPGQQGSYASPPGPGPAQERAQYDNLFRLAGGDKQGFIFGKEAVEFFSRSGVAKLSLRQVMPSRLVPAGSCGESSA
jgi:hypothetical protein